MSVEALVWTPTRTAIVHVFVNFWRYNPRRSLLPAMAASILPIVQSFRLSE